MKRILALFALTGVWVSLSGEWRPANFALGFVVSLLVLGLASHRGIASQAIRRVDRMLRFLVFFAFEYVVSNARVIYDILTPKNYLRPALVRVPLDTHNDLETLAVANVITLTPGSLSLDVDEDGRGLIVHAMYVDDIEKARRAIREGFERRVLEAMR